MVLDNLKPPYKLTSQRGQALYKGQIGIRVGWRVPSFFVLVFFCACFNVTCTLDSLVFNLVVEMSSEPVIEPRLFDIARSSQLHGHPIPAPVRVDLHGQVADLGHPREPVALQEPDEEIPAEAGPETTQQGREHQVEDEIKHAH